MFIENGNGGGGHFLEINKDGQALTQSEIHKEIKQHSTIGEAFVITSGFISVSATADQTSALLYIKNTSTTKSILINRVQPNSEVAAKWRLKVDPTGLSASTATAAVNMNRSSSNTLDATVEYGAQDATVTGGTVLADWIVPGGAADFSLEGALILGPNDSLAVEVIPFAAATGGEASVNVECWQALAEA